MSRKGINNINEQRGDSKSQQDLGDRIFGEPHHILQVTK